MSFRFDRQHLTGQQNAIAAQRDKVNETIKEMPSTKSKVEQLIDFIGKNQVFDLVMVKHEAEQSAYGNHHSMQVNVDGGFVNIPELHFEGVLIEETIESVEKKVTKMIFKDGVFPIRLSIIKRHV